MVRPERGCLCRRRPGCVFHAECGGPQGRTGVALGADTGLGECAAAHAGDARGREQEEVGEMAKRMCFSIFSFTSRVAWLTTSQTTIRVRFSDRTQLEKAFPSTSKIRAVYAFVRGSLREDVKPIKFVLCASGFSWSFSSGFELGHYRSDTPAARTQGL